MVAHQHIRSVLDGFFSELVERLNLQLLVRDFAWDAVAAVEGCDCEVVCVSMIARTVKI